MPFIGKTPETGAFRLIDSITTSATDTYALTVLGDHYFPESARNLIVSLNGVTQAPETAYTVSGSHIVFASALTASDVIDYILVIGDAVDIGTPSDGTVGNAQLKASLDLSGKTLTLANDQISGDVIHGGTISNFASTGIDDNATSTAITIDADENIGVGHASPVSLGAGYKNVDIRYTTGGGVTLGDTSNIHAYLFSDNNGVTLQAPGSRSIKFTTGSTTAITIDTSQNVGVGTPSPADKVHVEGGNLRVGADDNTNHSARVILNSGGASGYEAAVDFKYEGNSESRAKIHVNSSLAGLIFSTIQSGSITEDMRLDGSGNLLVGKTSAATNVEGGELRENGQVLAVATNINPFFAARLGSNGDLAVFRKDTTTVGSIGIEGGDSFYTQGGTTAGAGLLFHGAAAKILPLRNGATIDATIDLGQDSRRFKDLYLSGDIAHKDAANNARILYDKSANLLGNQGTNGSFFSIYLGGTGSANQMDDYEEGSWTPQVFYQNSTDQANATNTVQSGRYRKIGSLVYVTFRLDFSQGGSPVNDNIGVKNLPFAGSLNHYEGGGNVITSSSEVGLIFSLPNASSTVAVLVNSANVGNFGNEFGSGSNKYIRGSFTYITS